MDFPIHAWLACICTLACILPYLFELHSHFNMINFEHSNFSSCFVVFLHFLSKLDLLSLQIFTWYQRRLDLQASRTSLRLSQTWFFCWTMKFSLGLHSACCLNSLESFSTICASLLHMGSFAHRALDLVFKRLLWSSLLASLVWCMLCGCWEGEFDLFGGLHPPLSAPYGHLSLSKFPSPHALYRLSICVHVVFCVYLLDKHGLLSSW